MAGKLNPAVTVSHCRLTECRVHCWSVGLILSWLTNRAGLTTGFLFHKGLPKIRFVGTHTRWVLDSWSYLAKRFNQCWWFSFWFVNFYAYRCGVALKALSFSNLRDCKFRMVLDFLSLWSVVLHELLLHWLDTNLVDPPSSHMLVSKIKPCMSQYKSSYVETANGSLKQL